MKQLVIYYSHGGNTACLAKALAKKTGADLFQIEQIQPYSKGQKCVKEAEIDYKNHARPEIKDCPYDLKDYDRIYLGYPIYHGTVPMAVLTFLEKCDWMEKNIVPFSTHAGSGLGCSVSDIKKAAKGATVKNGIAINGFMARFSKGKLIDWAKNN